MYQLNRFCNLKLLFNTAIMMPSLDSCLLGWVKEDIAAVHLSFPPLEKKQTSGLFMLPEWAIWLCKQPQSFHKSTTPVRAYWLPQQVASNWVPATMRHLLVSLQRSQAAWGGTKWDGWNGEMTGQEDKWIEPGKGAGLVATGPAKSCLCCQNKMERHQWEKMEIGRLCSNTDLC